GHAVGGGFGDGFGGDGHLVLGAGAAGDDPVQLAPARLAQEPHQQGREHAGDDHDEERVAPADVGRQHAADERADAAEVGGDADQAVGLGPADGRVPVGEQAARGGVVDVLGGGE